ncbi:MAG: hypothetical protein ACO3HP_04625 [Candidatus Nanopelagicaceae bacterium]
MKLPEFRLLAKIPNRSAIIVFVVASLVAAIVVKCQVERESLLETYIEIRKHLPKGELPPHLRDIDDYFNREINKRPNLLKKKIQGDVDGTIKAYEEQERNNYKPRMTNKIILEYASKLPCPQRLVLESAIYYELPDGSMGIRGAWTNAHPDEMQLPLE